MKLPESLKKIQIFVKPPSTSCQSIENFYSTELNQLNFDHYFLHYLLLSAIITVF